MIKDTPQNQLSIFDFKAPFWAQLDIENRWVKMAIPNCPTGFISKK